MYNSYNGRLSIKIDVYFDEAHHYNKKNLKSQEFANDEWQKEDDELFVDPTDILDTSEPTPEFNTIPCKTYPYSNESCDSSPLSDIPDLVGDKEYDEEKNAFSSLENEKSRLQLNRGDRDSNIQLSETTPKQSRQNRLIKPTPDTRQSACLKHKMPASANVMHSISNSPFVPKSHIHMVIVLANLSASYDNSGSDEPLSLKEAKVSSYWKEFEKAIQKVLVSY